MIRSIDIAKYCEGVLVPMIAQIQVNRLGLSEVDIFLGRDDIFPKGRP